MAEQRNADASIERLRDGHHDLSERFNLVQGRFYSVGGDIARVEQSIQHAQGVDFTDAYFRSADLRGLDFGVGKGEAPVRLGRNREAIQRFYRVR